MNWYKKASDHEPIERMLEDALVVKVDKPTPTKRRKRRGKGSGFPHNENPIRQREMNIN